MCCESQAKPDYTPMAMASIQSNQIMQDLGNEQISFAKQIYNENKPISDAITRQQLESANETQQQGRDYYDYQTKTFRPLEKGIVADAENYNTEANRELLAGKAAADAGRAFEINKASSDRSMASMGVNPNSGRFAAITGQNNLNLSALKAKAMTDARTTAEATGYARKLDAAGLGRNLPGASQGAYTVATGAGNSAGNNSQAGAALAQNGIAQGAGTIGNGRTLLQGGLGNILNNNTSVEISNANSANEFKGFGIGAVGKIGASLLGGV